MGVERQQTDVDWEAIRVHYIDTPGITFRELAQQYGVTPQAVGQRCRREHWASQGEVVQRAFEQPNWGELVKRTSLKRIRNEGGSNFTGNREAVAVEVLTALADGASDRIAAEATGIHYDTWRFWCQRDQRLGELRRRAKALRAKKRLAMVDRAAERDWKAAAWALERDHYTREDFHVHREQAEANTLQIVINVPRADSVKPAIEGTVDRQALEQKAD